LNTAPAPAPARSPAPAAGPAYTPPPSNGRATAGIEGAFPGVTDPELISGFGALESRMTERLMQGLAQVREDVAPLTQHVRAQTESQRQALVKQIGEGLSKEFRAFADPDLGPQYLGEYLRTTQTQPWREPRTVAQEIQDRFDRFATRLIQDATRQPGAAGSPTPTATVPVGNNPPLVRATKPASVKDADVQADQAIRIWDQQAGR
jgi:hypothetical protein